MTMMDAMKPLPIPIGLRIEGECDISGESAEQIEIDGGHKIEVQRASTTIMAGKDSVAMLVVAGHLIPVALLLETVEKVIAEEAP